MEIESLVKPGGLVEATQVKHALEYLSISLQELMLKYVPIASRYSVSPISKFSVGAVVAGKEILSNGKSAEHGETARVPNLYLGANVEFAEQNLGFSIHAEQSAVANAHSNGETSLSALAVSAAPCGHCRQFLNEVLGAQAMPITFPSADGSDAIIQTSLAQLLPDSFGPSDLGVSGGFMQNELELPVFELPSMVSNDDLFKKAARVAACSYVPYTANYAGVALQMNNGFIVEGANIENAAFNPGLDPLRVALSHYYRHEPLAKDVQVARAVLVETNSSSSQKRFCSALLSSIAPMVEMEYLLLNQVIT